MKTLALMILDCRLMLLISNNIIHCAEILSVCLSADDLMSATKLYVRFSWNSVCYKIAGIRWSLWKRTLLRGVNEFISWSKWVKFDCISLLVKSLKDCKFFEKNRRNTNCTFGSTEITFCPRSTRTSSDLYKIRHTNKLSERHTFVKAVTAYCGE